MALALIEKRREAIRLRMAGLPYSDIRKSLGVSKSSLSYWLRNVELAEPHVKAITTNWVAKRVETYRQTVRMRTLALENRQLAEARRFFGKITKRDLMVAGLFLYLGEGQKGDRWQVGIANSDPAAIRFSVKWLTNILNVPKEDVFIKLHIYKDMDPKRESAFWSKVSGIPIAQFKNPYIKKSLFSSIDYRTHGHGTCNIIVGSGPVKQRIMARIKVILEKLNMGL